MNRETNIGRVKRMSMGIKVALVGAGVTAGAMLATTVGAHAATSTASTSGTTTTAVAQAPANNHGSAPVRSDESSVSSGRAAKLKAAALKAVPGGTVYRVETDSGDAAYEAHMTKANGTEVTVKFDKNGAVTAVEDGMGK